MHGATHLASATVLGMLLVSPQLPLLETSVFVGACVFGALLPDVDTPGSTLSRWFQPFKIFSLLGHRGIFHSWPVPLTLAIFWFRFEQQHDFWVAGILWFIFWGYLSHLLLDMMNPSGIPLLWPLPRAARVLPLALCVKSGALWDWVLMFLFAFAVIFLVSIRYPMFWMSLQAWFMSLGLL